MKRKKVFTIIGVMALIIAIIGVTFAYFSATVTSSGSAIGGTTNSSIASSLSLNIDKVLTQSVGSNDLVPTDINGTTSDITRAINANCESDGYTGCHLYKITATAYQNMANVNINLESLTTTNTRGKDKWNYSIFTASDNGSGNSIYSNVTLVTGGDGTFDRVTPFDMHNNSSLTVNTPAIYYLLIWIENDTTNSQNNNDNNDVTGSYTGIVNMQAAGGKVVACFDPNGQCSGSSSNNNNNNQQTIPEGIYLVTDEPVYEGLANVGWEKDTPLSSITYYNHNAVINNKNATELAMADWALITDVTNDTKPFFLRFTIGTYETNGQLVSNVPVEGYVGFVVDKATLKAENCTANDSACETKYNNMVDGTYYLQGWVNESSESAENQIIYNTNINTIKTAFGYNNGNSSYCNGDSSNFNCHIAGLSILYVGVGSIGSVYANDGSHGCVVGNTAGCY